MVLGIGMGGEGPENLRVFLAGRSQNTGIPRKLYICNVERPKLKLAPSMLTANAFLLCHLETPFCLVIHLKTELLGRAAVTIGERGHLMPWICILIPVPAVMSTTCMA